MSTDAEIAQAAATSAAASANTAATAADLAVSTLGDSVAEVLAAVDSTSAAKTSAEAAKIAAELARDQAETARSAAEAVGDTNDAIMAGVAANPMSSFSITQAASFAGVLARWKGDVLATAFRFTAAPTYDANGVISGGPIAWPDGGTGVYTVTSTDTNGSVTGFTATTTGGPVGTKTATVTIPRDTNSYISGAMTLVVS